MWHRSLLSLHFTKILNKNLSNPKFLSTTTPTNLNQKWRKEKGLPLNPNSCGGLTDGPDYSFLDGRPTPYGIGQKNRLQKQQEIAEQIISLTSEVDFAVERHDRLLLEEKERRQRILDSKLKPKGIELLKKKK